MRIPKSVADIGCIPTDGTAYTGNASTTESGLICQMWSVNTPHEHSNTGVGEHNYCRSPDGDAIWCYTTDPGTKWEYCDVPFCMTYTKGIDFKIFRWSRSRYSGYSGGLVESLSCLSYQGGQGNSGQSSL